MANKLHPVNLNKSRFCILAMLWVFGILLAACQPDIQSVEPTPNPNPKEIYEITVTVENAPGEFISADGTQDFYIVNSSECIPPYTSMSGAAPVAISDSQKISYKKVTSNIFVTRVIMDRYVARDDYGRGLCKWAAASVSVTLYNGINEHYASIDAPEEVMVKRASRIEFFDLKESVENPGKDIPNEPIDESREYTKDEFFFITMNAKKVMP